CLFDRTNSGCAPSVAWSIAVHPGHKLTAPVFDFGSKNIFVADDSQVSFVQDTGSTTPTLCLSGPCLGGNVITGLANITDSPMIVVGNTTNVLVFSGTNGANAVV